MRRQGGNILESVKDPKKKKKQSFRVFLMDPWSVNDNAFSFVVHIWAVIKHQNIVVSQQSSCKLHKQDYGTSVYTLNKNLSITLLFFVPVFHEMNSKI